jgi:hypothetical protein
MMIFSFFPSIHKIWVCRILQATSRSESLTKSLPKMILIRCPHVCY